MKYNFSGFADEIAPELDAQIATLNEIGVKYMELRSVDKINVGDFTMEFAKEIASRVLFVDQKSILADNTPENVFNHPENERVKEFLSKL